MAEIEKQNTDFWSQFSPDRDLKLAQREEIQQILKTELQKLKTEKDQELQSLQEKIQSSPEKTDEMRKILDSLSGLEKKIDEMHLLDGERFTLESQRIQEQLNTLKSAREDLTMLKNQVKSEQAARIAQISSQLPAHDPRANQQRNQSIQKILDIKPQDWENPIANRAASWIQKLIS